MKIVIALVALFLFAAPVRAEEPPFLASLVCEEEPGTFLVEVLTPEIAEVSISGPDEYIGVDTFVSEPDFWGEGTFGFAWGSDTLTFPGWVKVFVPGYEVILYNEECGEYTEEPWPSYPPPTLVTPPPLPTPPDTAIEAEQNYDIGRLVLFGAIAAAGFLTGRLLLRRK